MTGVKGKSGKCNTPEAHAAKVRAARAGGNATAGRRPGPVARPDPASPADDLLALLPGANPYDRVVLLSEGRFTYLDAKTREQVNGEVLSNEKIMEDLALARAEKFTADQVDDREKSIADIFLRHLDGVSALVASLVPPEKINEARQKSAEWVARIREQVADEIGALNA